MSSESIILFVIILVIILIVIPKREYYYGGTKLVTYKALTWQYDEYNDISCSVYENKYSTVTLTKEFKLFGITISKKKTTKTCSDL